MINLFLILQIFINQKYDEAIKYYSSIIDKLKVDSEVKADLLM